MSPGSVAGGGAIELVAEEGSIVISNELICFEFMQINILRACLHGGGGPQVGEVTRLAVVEK